MLELNCISTLFRLASNKYLVLCIHLILLEITMSTKVITSVDFEVYGRVQGVFFRKFTQEQGKKLGLKGWCMNTESGTVTGVMEGEQRQIEAMKKWLQETGSPMSKIEKAVFKNEKKLDNYTYKDFSVVD
uniref:Acylphosphatase n=1 Tax=Cuerna arida TaxID=1464854 RepID=A0A1B6F9J5_9HEMI